MCHIGMHSNLNFPAPVALLGFLAGLGGLALCGVATAILAFFRKVGWIRWIGKLLGAGAIVYFGLLFGFSLGSRETTLHTWRRKVFLRD